MDDGKIKDRRTLVMILAAVVITQTQNTVADGACAFTRRTGAIPRTISDLMSSVYEPAIKLTEVTESGADAIKALTYYVEEQCAWFQEERDYAHRNAMYSRLASERSKHTTQFRLLVGDYVSYEGKRWKLMDLMDPPDQPITAIIQQAIHKDAHQIKTVRVGRLQNLAATRQKLNIRLDTTPAVDHYIFFNADGTILTGKITNIVGTEITVHVHDPSPQVKSFLHCWVQGDQDKSQWGKNRGYLPELMITEQSQIEVLTTLESNFRVPDTALKELAAKGSIMPFEYETPLQAISAPAPARPRSRRGTMSRRQDFSVTHDQHE